MTSGYNHSLPAWAAIRWSLLIGGVLIPAYLINLSVRPLTKEEPRRMVISMEMQENGQYWAPSWYRQPYTHKPPLFNWVLLLSSSVVGEPDEWAARLPTVLAAFLLAVPAGRLGSRYVDRPFGWLVALLWLCSVDILYYFSLLGEIDVFFSLLAFASMASVFHFYQQKRPWALYLSAYGLCALGFMTKGIPAILFTGLTVFSFFAFKRAWNRLLHPAHAAGMLLFAAITGVYFWQYSRYADLNELLFRLLSESGNRTVMGSSFPRFVFHQWSFPLDTLKTLLPATLFLMFWHGKQQFWQKVSANPWVQFALIVFLVNYLPYQLSPGSRQRYLYPLFPFALTVLAWLYHQSPDQHAGRRVLRLLVRVVAAGCIPAGMVLWAVPAFHVPGCRLLPALLLSLAGLALLFVSFRRPESSVYQLLLLMAVFRLVMDITVLPGFVLDSEDRRNRDSATAIFEAVGTRPLFIEEKDHLSGTTLYYLHRLRNRTLELDSTFRTDGLYLVRDSRLDRTRCSDVLLNVPSGKNRYLLVQYY